MAAADLVARLQKQLFELGLPAKFIQEIVERYTLVSYDKGSQVFVSGSHADLFFYIFGGMLKLYYQPPEGNRVLVSIAGPGELVGYVDYIDSNAQRAQVLEARALSKSSVAIFTRHQVLKLASCLDQATLCALFERLNTVWSAVLQRFGMMFSMPFKQRLEFVLRELSDKFGVVDSRGTLVMPQLSHDDFADMIGSSRPMVSRLIAEMIKEGTILMQGKQLILLKTANGHLPHSMLRLKEGMRESRHARRQ